MSEQTREQQIAVRLDAVLRRQIAELVIGLARSQAEVEQLQAELQQSRADLAAVVTVQ